MEGGRPEPSGRPRAPRLVARGLAVVVLVLAGLLAAPLILRGRVLRWVVARAGAPVCGSFQLADGRFGATLVPDLLLGHAFTVELEGVSVAAPDGTVVMAAQHVRARVTVARAPWRIVVDDAVATQGLWRLAVGGATGSAFLDAFRPVRDGDRAACLARATPGPPRVAAAPPSPPHGTLRVNDLRLDGIDVDLEFPAWGLALPGVHTTGMLLVGDARSGGLLFDARDAEAPGGVLRVGPPGGAKTTRARFDDVVISRVGITADRPTDLVLVVKRARTGHADLTGTAVFESVVPVPGFPQRLPAIALDARWEDAGDALDKLEAAWLPPGATLEGVGLGGLVTAKLRGPFQALSGELTAEGTRAHILATLENGARATADVRTTGLDLTPLLDAGSRPYAGGLLTGQLRAAVDFGPRAADLDATIDDADVTLARARAGAGPRSLTFRIGLAGARSTSPASTADALTVALSRARFHARTLALEGLRAAWATASVAGRLALSFPKVQAGVAPPSPRLDARLTLAVASLARFVPAKTADARFSAEARLTGPLDHLEGSLAFTPTSRVLIRGARFRPPRAATATLDDGRVLTFSGVVFTHDGGGTVEARGRVARAALAASLRVKRYPLAQLPGLASVRVPAALAHGRVVALDTALAGALDATLSLGGTVEHPTLAGVVALSDVVLVGRRLGDARLDVRARPDTLAVTGTVGSAVTVSATMSPRRGSVAGDVKVKVDDLALGPWLPPPLEGLPLDATGEAQLTLAPPRSPTVQGSLRVAGAGNDVTLAGHATPDALTGTLRGRIELAAARALWSPRLAEADGGLALALAADEVTAATALDRVSGTIEIARALHLRAAGWPRDVSLDVAAGGRLDVTGPRWHTTGLDLSTDGARARVSGDVTLDRAAPERSRVALTATARLDAARLARHVPALAAASGTLTLDARATGEARAPVASGEARLDDVELRARAAGWPTLRLDGTVEASGHTLRTRDLRVETGPAGALTLGDARTPASLVVTSWWPFVPGSLDVPLAGRGLHLGDGRTAFEISDLDLALRLTGEPATALTLTGDIGVAKARFDTGRGVSAKAGPARPWYASLPPRLTLDLTLHGPDDALVVGVPGPDVTLGFQCHVRASAHGATLSGRLHGGTLYSRVALALYDWSRPQDVRACRVFKE
jgi:hypothetical protein